MANVKEPYNQRTLQLFERPIHAGALQGCYTDTAVAQASESEAGARLQLAVGLQDGKIKECRFRVFGCPHLIAAAEWLCSHAEGDTMTDLANFRAEDCMQQLAVPVEKTGRLLLLEDAIRSLTAELQDG
jgi:NifU-like protein involved in Fe-S cluster formation